MKTAVARLKPGDRFSFIPSAWHGPAVVRDIAQSGSLLKLTFYNRNIVNPPGICYVPPETVVTRLKRAATAKAGHALQIEAQAK